MITPNEGGGEGATAPAQSLPVFTVNVRVAPGGDVKLTLWADDKALAENPAAAVAAANLSKAVRDMAKPGAAR